MSRRLLLAPTRPEGDGYVVIGAHEDGRLYLDAEPRAVVPEGVAVVAEDGAEGRYALLAGTEHAPTVLEGLELDGGAIRRRKMGGLSAPTYPDWAPGVAYAAGARRMHQGTAYEIIQPHTSQVGWEPPNVPALWRVIAAPGQILDWAQPAGAHDAIPLGGLRRHAGRVWISTIPANVWQPGSVGAEGLWRIARDLPPHRWLGEP